MWPSRYRAPPRRIPRDAARFSPSSYFLAFIPCLGGDNFDHDQKLGPHEPGNDTEEKNGLHAEVTLTRSALPASHRQHDPEARLAAHHAVVGLGGPFQGVHFVH